MVIESVTVVSVTNTSILVRVIDSVASVDRNVVVRLVVVVD